MENKTSKYFKYAIGEIILVMVGILLALQVNNWNEGRKLQKLEKTYLLGILNDLKTDTLSINKFVMPNFLEHKKHHLFLDSLVDNNLMIEESILSMVWGALSLTKSGRAFYPTIGNYDSMISEGNSGLIKDRELFSSIQELYEISHAINIDIIHRRDRMIDDIRSKYTYNFQYNTKLENLRNKQLLADLRFIYEYKRNYTLFLEDLKANIHSLTNRIENYLADD